LSAYADTSFLASLYAADANSAAAATRMKHVALPILLTPLGEFELINALHLRFFRREISPSRLRSALQLVRSDIENEIYRLTPIPSAAFREAVQLASKHTPILGRRSLDVLHVACAVSLQASLFLTFDLRQRELARIAGLSIAQL
jgi:predicted nucleic acid-binding protein